jgi:hypothetical protein
MVVRSSMLSAWVVLDQLEGDGRGEQPCLGDEALAGDAELCEPVVALSGLGREPRRQPGEARVQELIIRSVALVRTGASAIRR